MKRVGCEDACRGCNFPPRNIKRQHGFSSLPPGVGPRMPLSVAAPKASNASSLPPWVWWVARAVAIRLRRIPAISGPTCP